MMSAEHFLPTEESLPAHHRSIERMALYVTRNNDTLRSHWEKLGNLEADCNQCRNDRRAVDELVLARLKAIDEKQADMARVFGWGNKLLWAAFCLANLFLAAKTAGVFK